MIKYVAEITNGDTYHKSGELYFIRESEIDEVLKNGYRFYESKCGPDGAQIYYPCKIYKREYTITNETTIGTSSNTQVKTDYCEDNSYDWKDHWC